MKVNEQNTLAAAGVCVAAAALALGITAVPAYATGCSAPTCTYVDINNVGHPGNCAADGTNCDCKWGDNSQTQTGCFS
jgi:hypothetical protein